MPKAASTSYGRCSELALSNSLLTREKNELKRYTHELIKTVNSKTEQDRVTISGLRKACSSLETAKVDAEDDCAIRIAEQQEDVEIMDRQLKKLTTKLADREKKLSNHQALVQLNGELNEQVHLAVRERDELVERLALYERQAKTVSAAGDGLRRCSWRPCAGLRTMRP